MGARPPYPLWVRISGWVGVALALGVFGISVWRAVASLLQLWASRQ